MCMRDESITTKDRLQHIIEAIEEIETFTVTYTKESFLKDSKVINATLFQFAIIGEAIRNVDRAILEKYAYPWHKVIGFRNFILHEYHAISFRIVWEAIQGDLPELKNLIKKILSKEF